MQRARQRRGHAFKILKPIDHHAAAFQFFIKCGHCARQARIFITEPHIHHFRVSKHRTLQFQKSDRPFGFNACGCKHEAHRIQRGLIECCERQRFARQALRHTAQRGFVRCERIKAAHQDIENTITR